MTETASRPALKWQRPPAAQVPRFAGHQTWHAWHKGKRCWVSGETREAVTHIGIRGLYRGDFALTIAQAKSYVERVMQGMEPEPEIVPVEDAE